MNAADFPLGHARFELVSRNEDGTLLRCPFLSRELADTSAAHLSRVVPEGQFFVHEPTPVLPGLKGKV